MDLQGIIQHISGWMKDYADRSGQEGFVIGISGGIDSAVTSVLCAMTGRRVIALSLPIKQAKKEHDRAEEHLEWLKSNFSNVETGSVDLTGTFQEMERSLPAEIQDFLAMANLRARLRMSTLYTYASHHKLLVAGTGNKVEDFGIGFFTKYGDGGVDISPIADLYKTEIYELAKAMNVPASIQKAAPTDGLFNDSRTDEDQIGASYPELEWAMEYIRLNKTEPLTARQKEVMKIYSVRHAANLHKINPIPVCEIPDHLKYNKSELK